MIRVIITGKSAIIITMINWNRKLAEKLDLGLKLESWVLEITKPHYRCNAIRGATENAGGTTVTVKHYLAEEFGEAGWKVNVRAQRYLFIVFSVFINTNYNQTNIKKFYLFSSKFCKI